MGVGPVRSLCRFCLDALLSGRERGAMREEGLVVGMGEVGGKASLGWWCEHSEIAGVSIVPGLVDRSLKAVRAAPTMAMTRLLLSSVTGGYYHGKLIFPENFLLNLLVFI